MFLTVFNEIAFALILDLPFRFTISMPTSNLMWKKKPPKWINFHHRLMLNQLMCTQVDGWSDDEALSYVTQNDANLFNSFGFKWSVNKHTREANIKMSCVYVTIRKWRWATQMKWKKEINRQKLWHFFFRAEKASKSQISLPHLISFNLAKNLSLVSF